MSELRPCAAPGASVQKKNRAILHGRVRIDSIRERGRDCDHVQLRPLLLEPPALKDKHTRLVIG